MATMLLQLVDETDPDFYIDAGLPKRGDVVRLHDGGPESFGPYYHNNPAYRIVPLRGTVAQFAALLESEPIVDVLRASRTRRHREVQVDPDTVTDGMRPVQILARVRRLPRLADPAMFLVG